MTEPSHSESASEASAGLPRGAASSPRRRWYQDPSNALNALLILIPVAAVLYFKHAPPMWTFLVAAGAVIPLAGLIGKSTEVLAHSVGPALGGLLNATLGNAAELIIAIMLLRAGELEVVKASLTGSIIGNLLLVLGLALLVAGLRYKTPVFNAVAAESSAGMLFVAVIALVVPAVFHNVQPGATTEQLSHLSIGISIVLILLYVLGLLFTLKTHKYLFQSEEADKQAVEEHVQWSLRKAVIVLLVATGGVIYMSEILAHTVETASEQLGLTHTFVGIIIIAVVGNAAEHSTAILVASKNKMDLALGIAIESSKQIALFVAPVLVLLSLWIAPTPMSLEFTMMEVIAVISSVAIVTVAILNGQTNWLEGAQLLAVYGILGVVFFYVP